MMANLHGDDRVVIDDGDGCRSGNSLLIAEACETEAGRNNHTDPTESQKGCKRVNSSSDAEKSVFDLEEGQPKKKMKKKAHNDGRESRSFFDCNICLDVGREPVVTCCGHLFCWACFYQVRYVDSSAKTKECPVCRGEVTDCTIIPIYGNGMSLEKSGLDIANIPPRPKGQRIEREAISSQKGCKRGNSSPTAEQSVFDLEEGWQTKKIKKAYDDCGDIRSLLDCNICKDKAREPVVTYCGHLFCWACCYQVPYVDSSSKMKECPVCREEVTDSSIIPIYGNEDRTDQSQLELSYNQLPPRPKAQRIECVMGRPGSQIPIAESSTIAESILDPIAESSTIAESILDLEVFWPRLRRSTERAPLLLPPSPTPSP